jgi:hypothetical protein
MGSVLETNQTSKERAVFVERLSVRPAPAGRMELVGRLDEVVGATETRLELYLATVEAMQGSLERLLPNPPPEPDMTELRAKLEGPVRDATLAGMLFSYRAATNDDLWGYLTYWQTQHGRRFSQLSREALLAGVVFAGDSIERAVAEGARTMTMSSGSNPVQRER